jgi:hypothetical protein
MTAPGEPRVYPDAVPDPTERAVRIACGLLLGIGLGAAAWLRAHLDFWPGTIVMLASMAGCAWGALRRGDEFWMAVLRRWR